MKRRDEVIVGVFITIAVIIGIAGTLWLARRGFSKTYPVYARFDWGSGLKNGQPVLLAGVQVGFVDDVELRREGYLFVTMGINQEYEIPDGSKATVIPVGFFGDMAVAIKPQDFTMASIPPGDTLPAGEPPPAIDDILARLDTVSRGVADVTEAFQIQMVKKGGLAELRETIASTNDLLQTLNSVAAKQSVALSRTLATLDHTVSAIDSAAVDSTMQHIEVTTRNLAGLTENLQHLTARLNTTVAKLDSGGGTAAKLLNDPALYNDLHDLVAQLDSVTSDFKRNPRKYINLEIF